MQGSLVLVLFCAVAISASEGINADSRQTEFRVEQLWNAYKTTFERNYRTSYAERMRKEIFSERVQQIQLHNSLFEQGKVSFKIGLNEFSDLMPEELKSLLGLKLPKPARKTWLYSFDTDGNIDTTTAPDPDINTITTFEEEISFTTESNFGDEEEPYVRENLPKRRRTTKKPNAMKTTTQIPRLPTTTSKPPLQPLPPPPPPPPVDWRDDPCMPPIKNQGNCGNCWAFASVAPLEFDDCKRRTLASPIRMSEQQLTDCVSTTDGCGGGFYTAAWAKIKQKKGISAEIDYPLVSNVSGTWTKPCRTISKMATNVDTYSANYLSEAMMQDAISRKQIVAVAIYVTNGFMHYKSGIYMDTTKKGCDQITIKKSVNHAVTVVGYGTDATTNTAYWVIRNSWGTTWGMDGYMHMKKGTNLCNIGLYGVNVTTTAPV